MPRESAAVGSSAEQRIDELSDALLDAIAQEPMPSLLRERCRNVVRKHLAGPLLDFVEGSCKRPLQDVLDRLVLVYDPSHRQVSVGLKC